MEFTLTDKKFHHIDALNEFVNLKDFCRWAGIDIDPDGRVWMVLTQQELSFMILPIIRLRLPFANDSVQQKKVSDDNVILYCDKDGMAWSGSFSQKAFTRSFRFLLPLSIMWEMLTRQMS